MKVHYGGLKLENFKIGLTTRNQDNGSSQRQMELINYNFPLDSILSIYAKTSPPKFCDILNDLGLITPFRVFAPS